MNKKEFPILFIDKKDCCGCGACCAACVIDSISMVKDNEGFFYPLIDTKKCIKCYLCLNICPIKKYDKKSD